MHARAMQKVDGLGEGIYIYMYGERKEPKATSLKNLTKLVIKLDWISQNSITAYIIAYTDLYVYAAPRLLFHLCIVFPYDTFTTQKTTLH